MSRTACDHIDALQDPDHMRGVFQKYLQPPDNPALLVETCTIDLVRMASARCLLQYTVELRENGASASRRQIITGVAYSGDRAQRVWERIRLSGAVPTSPMPGSGLPPIAFAPELQLVMQAFPFDFRLPGLFHLTQDPSREVTSLILDDLGPGDWRLETWDADPVRYRVDMRAVVRLTVRAREIESGQATTRRLFAKIYSEEGLAAEAHAIQELLWQQTAGGAAAFTVARPIAHLRDLRTVLFEEAPGTSLLDLLRQEHDPLPVVACTARALAALHQFPLADVIAGRSRDVRDERARLTRLAKALRAATPTLTPAINEIADTINAAQAVDMLAPTHFDLKPGHLLIDGERVTMLDFDKLAAADPLVDVASLAVNLGKARGGGRRQPAKARAITDAFVADYFSQVPAEWYPRFPAHYALALLAEAANSGRGLRGRAEKSGRTDRMASLIQEAHDALQGNRW